MQDFNLSIQRILLFGLLLILVYLGFDVLKYFIVPVLWACIIAYMTWPLYKRILSFCGEQRSTLSATLMTLLLILVVGIPFTFAIFLLQQEGRNLYFDLQKQLLSGHLNVPEFIGKLPFIGQEVTRIVQDINENPRSLSQSIGMWIQGHLNYGKFVLNEISKNLIKLCFAVMSLFFFYRDGRVILHQVSKALEKIIGPRIHHYLDTISETTRAVVYGIGLTAVAQAILAGLSYFVAGVPNPMVLTIATFILALIPFGTPVAYTAVSVWLLSKGLMIEAIGVFAWGVCIVSTSDNVIRPLVISGSTQIPFLLIMFGVLGGLASFGFVGLFIGPVILAILLAIWREWLHETIEPTQMPKGTLAYDIDDPKDPPKNVD
ncbi:AI-2E family transporter [Acinetobacter gerneri]|uniref:AI-2E family transporter n=1 Tax=Acinetobacter gerneri TaxID=202952 RepID=A0AAW8JIY2_9GAMM|nr:AI-2E family transporter [Acinetobacter gerneri]MDQ9011633.1 AI-2E family transporter [Acinetobacter gerneri]MDQ9014474.1 AI-2E family transporter [Acinetobacter gerneri]MDQ9025645.1 AI-2E family transporter [Acinetobacter gerneri]MDQ9052926.1 AI-2E family transporter [Acinetobacter gerneri]MDQ9060471.1 AI-2E family transporter [Acinetobacter gerneri]